MIIDEARKKILSFGKSNLGGKRVISGRVVTVSKINNGWKGIVEVLIKNKRSKLTRGFDPTQPELPNVRETYEVVIEGEKVVGYERTNKEKLPDKYPDW